MTPRPSLTAAEVEHLAWIEDDCELLLGPGAEMLELLPEPADPGVRLVARYRLGDRDRESAASGETMLAAHAALRDALVVDRLRFDFSDLVQPG